MYSPHIRNESKGGKTDINIQNEGEQTDFVISWFPWFLMISRDFNQKKSVCSPSITKMPMELNFENIKQNRPARKSIIRKQTQNLSIDYYSFSNNVNILNMYIAK